jgi:hypothetical protein
MAPATIRHRQSTEELLDPAGPLLLKQKYTTKIAFAENQPSPSLISLSPLFTTYPRALRRP